MKIFQSILAALLSSAIWITPQLQASELVCENPSGCPWRNGECIGCIERAPIPKTEPKVPSAVIPKVYQNNTTNHIQNNTTNHFHSNIVRQEYILSRPPSISFSNPSVILTDIFRDSSGWRFRASNGSSYECLLPPLRPSDKSGVFSCGGVRVRYFVFF